MRRVILILGIWLYLLTTVAVTAQTPLPDLPAHGLDLPLLFPDAALSGPLAGDRYLMLAEGTITLDYQRITGNSTPLLRLLDTDGQILVEQEATDLSGKIVRLSYAADEPQWLVVELGVRVGETEEGEFSVRLQGSPYTIYTLHPSGLPPQIEHQGIFLGQGSLEMNDNQPPVFLIALNEGVSVAIQAENGNLNLSSIDETLLVEGQGILTYTAAQTGWGILRVAGATSITLELSEPSTPIIISQSITLTPTQIPTLTPTATAMLTATATSTFKPTATRTPTFPPTLTPTQFPPVDRSHAPPNTRLLDGGSGITDGRTMNNGEMQLEDYCSRNGYAVGHNDADWYCMRANGSVEYFLDVTDLDAICRETYNNRQAFAIQDGTGEIPAFRWRCYGL